MNLDPIKAAVRRAALLCHEVQQHYLVKHSKGEQDPVTIADYGSQALICEALSRAFPEDAVMAEENGQQFQTLVDPSQRDQITQLIGQTLETSVSAETVSAWLDFNQGHTAPRTWVIDPVDGTKGFLALRHYVIAIAVLEGGVPIAGVMGAPAYPGYSQGALFWALNGELYIEGLNGSEASRRVHASTHSDPQWIRVLESVEKGHASHERMALVRRFAGLADAPLERVDSQEKYARIAAGDGELYLRLPRQKSPNVHSIWDHAPGTALLLAGGGKVTDIDGSPLDFTQGRTMAKNQGMIVSNGVIHDQVLGAVEQLLRDEQAS
ncbi:MAG: inositol monophosphatase family protein [Anaerolineae bacterium]|jgi:3'(2'), 5'-bisphosphate nucleotidase|nr:inositol monophosphatase family protein [Anaerolineae bacterium]